VLEIIVPALVSLATAKYASNTRNDPKAPIGGGTAPSLDPGPPIQVTPVEGTEVQDFGDFETENITEPQNLTEEEQLIAMLQQAGVDPEGLVSLAFGGAVQNKSDGGGLFDLFPDLAIDFKQYADSVNFANPIMEKPLEETMVDQIAQQEASENGIGKITIDDVKTPVVGQEQTNMQKFANIYATDPELFKTGVGSLTKVLAALMTDQPERKGSMVRTQTLPGNSARRRSAQMNIQPIGGSKVTFANEGTALKRPMFMPHGGQMRGPGGPKDDMIPVMASNGEFMLSKAAVDAAGNGSHAKGLARLEAFNKMGNLRYG